MFGVENAATSRTPTTGSAALSHWYFGLPFSLGASRFSPPSLSQPWLVDILFVFILFLLAATIVSRWDAIVPDAASGSQSVSLVRISGARGITLHVATVA
jgi:hypothetical protein